MLAYLFVLLLFVCSVTDTVEQGGRLHVRYVNWCRSLKMFVALGLLQSKI